MTDLAFQSASTLAAAIRDKTISSRELLTLYLQRVAQHNPALNAVVTLDTERALARADAADAALARGECWGPLHGVPMTVKDSFETAGLRTTAGAAVLAGHVPAAMPWPCNVCARPALSCSARPTCRVSRWTCSPTTRCSAAPTTPGT